MNQYLPPPEAANPIPRDPDHYLSWYCDNNQHFQCDHCHPRVFERCTCQCHQASDPTEDVRQLMLAVGQPQADLLAEEGPVWDTGEAVSEFRFLAFAAPFVLVERRSDGARGTLEFTHNPRRYFNFQLAP